MVLPVTILVSKLRERRELAHPVLVLARELHELCENVFLWELGMRCQVVSEDFVPVKLLALVVVERLFSHIRSVIFVPELDRGHFIGHISWRSSCKTRPFLNENVVAVPSRHAELAEQLVGVQQIGHDTDEHDPALLLPQEKAGLHLAGLPPIWRMRVPGAVVQQGGYRAGGVIR